MHVLLIILRLFQCLLQIPQPPLEPFTVSPCLPGHIPPVTCKTECCWGAACCWGSPTGMQPLEHTGACGCIQTIGRDALPSTLVQHCIFPRFSLLPSMPLAPPHLTWVLLQPVSLQRCSPGCGCSLAFRCQRGGRRDGVRSSWLVGLGPGILGAVRWPGGSLPGELGWDMPPAETPVPGLYLCRQRIGL